VHKANIMKFTDGLYLRVAQEVAAENDDIEFDDRIVDNMCMQLVQRPEEYDVLVLPNLYGDVLSDLCAGMIGGLGLAPGGNFGKDIAIFEPTHGSAPKYAGQNKVNPMAQMLSGMMMLRHLGEQAAADHLEGAIADVIREGKSVTYDMKPTRNDPSAVGTSEVADAIIEKLASARCKVTHGAGTLAQPAPMCSPRATTPTSSWSTSRKACPRERRSTSTRWAPCSATSRASAAQTATTRPKALTSS
jgi:isocitrate/isopropylmalate dehydrogenase